MATHPRDPSPGGTSASACPVCDAPMTRRKAWLYACPACRFLKADLPPGAGAGPSPPLAVAGALYLGAVVVAPLLRLLPGDIIVHFTRKR